MTPQDIKALNNFVDSIIFKFEPSGNGSINLTARADGSKLTRYQQLMIASAYRGFEWDIINPLMEWLLNKFEGHRIDQWLIDRLDGHLKLKEQRIVESGGLSLKDEIKKRLGILPDYKRMESELENVFSEALHGH